MNNTIYRQAAVDIVEFECGEWIGLARTIVKRIKQLPPAQQERKTGQWIKRKKGALGYDCTCCGKSEISNHFDYCPHCGADMRGN